MRSMVEGWSRIACDPTTRRYPSVTALRRAAPPPHSLREQGGDGFYCRLICPARITSICLPICAVSCCMVQPS